jgi:hypothetical protein
MLSFAVLGGVLVGIGVASAAAYLGRLKRPLTAAALGKARWSLVSFLVTVLAGVLCILIGWRSGLTLWLGPVIIVVITADWVWVTMSRRRHRGGHGALFKSL